MDNRAAMVYSDRDRCAICSHRSLVRAAAWIHLIMAVKLAQMTLIDHTLEIAERVARHLGQIASCSVSGVLIVSQHRGRMVLWCCRPVEELFLQAVQQRLLHSYQLSAGPALSEPPIEVTVRGEQVPGPYEPPRSFLTVPILAGGRVVGVLGVASIFPDLFTSTDLCKITAVAARAAETLDNGTRPRSNGGSPAAA
jgi:GAF domain-containing protein